MSLFGDIANLATSASQSSGGSTQGGYNISSNSAYNFSDSGSRSQSDSWSYGATYGSEATAKSYAEALRAHNRQQDFYSQEQAYNAEQAEIQRIYNQLMASTTYQRSIEDMKKAGINPILAASFGLSADSVNSGAAASVSSPSTFMGQTFADQRSASQSHSESSSWSHGEGGSQGSSSGNSWGSSWQNSTSGLSTFLDQMSLTTQGLVDMINSGQVVNNAIDTFEDITGKVEKAGNVTKAVSTVISEAMKGLGELWNTSKDPVLNSMYSNLRNRGLIN